MLTKRIIPCLDIKEGRVVKGVKFLGLRDAGDPVEVAKEYDRQQADELVFLDITASFEQRKTLIQLVEKIAKNIFMPFTVGGGISSVQDIRDLLNAGADKVSINTAAVRDPDLVARSAAKFGSQCIVVAIDAKKHTAPARRGWQVYIHGGRTPTELETVDWARTVAGLGAGEILLTSMDCDGTKDGYDLALTKAVAEAITIPVIASGGAGAKEHFRDVLLDAKADAALAASLFHYQELDILQLKRYLKENNVPVRIEEANEEPYVKKKDTFDLKTLKFDSKGLIPAIIQDYRNSEVLMVAYMNLESVRRTIKLGKTCFWSRSRKEYWVKGLTSGHFQFVKSIAYDCDQDALLIKVRQVGAACHTGNRSCFYRRII